MQAWKNAGVPFSLKNIYFESGLLFISPKAKTNNKFISMAGSFKTEVQLEKGFIYFLFIQKYKTTFKIAEHPYGLFSSFFTFRVFYNKKKLN